MGVSQGRLVYMANKQVVVDHVLPTAIVAAHDTRHCGDSMPSRQHSRLHVGGSCSDGGYHQ
jgi:hypothetical protein